MKQNPSFKHEIFKFIHKPIREVDAAEGKNFLERYVFGPQKQFEKIYEKIDKLTDLYNPAKTPVPRFLKDIVGFTKELDSITNDISDQDLRKLIALAVALWKQKGLERGYINIVRLFTGKNSRAFNWFDFRLIVGEQSFGEEQLGEDAWLISRPGVFASLPLGNVALLLPFEDDMEDRSVNRLEVNPDTLEYFFVNNGSTGGSGAGIYLHGAALKGSLDDRMDFSGSFTIEMFFNTIELQEAVLFSTMNQAGTKGVELKLDTTDMTLTYTLKDGSMTKSETVPALFAAEGLYRHVALVVDRTAGLAKLFYDGQEASSGLSVAGFGNPTVTGEQFSIAKDYVGILDNFRVSRSAQYGVNASTLPVPGQAFIEYQTEQLDEYYTDIRVVDEGDLNRRLVKRILNLMRPVSERLRIVYVRVYEDFVSGKGVLTSKGLQAGNVANGNLLLPVSSREECDARGNADFQDIYLQTRFKINTTSGKFAVRFFIQNENNYYKIVFNLTAQQMEFYKVVAGVEIALAAPVFQEVYDQTFYVVTLSTDHSALTGQSQLEVRLDQNVIFNVNDGTFQKGTFSMETDSTTTAEVSEIEMFLKPLETDTIKPNDVI